MTESLPCLPAGRHPAIQKLPQTISVWYNLGMTELESTESEKDAEFVSPSTKYSIPPEIEASQRKISDIEIANAQASDSQEIANVRAQIAAAGEAEVVNAQGQGQQTEFQRPPEQQPDIDQYFNRNLFWRSLQTQAIENTMFDSEESNQNIGLFSNIHIKNDALIAEQLKIAVNVLKKMAERGSQDPRVIAFSQDLQPDNDLTWQHRMDIIKWSREAVLDSIGMPDTAYHASGFDASEIDISKIGNIVLESSDSGAMDPGVYMSPYIESMYFGGDQAQRQIQTPVIFEITPDEDCHAYPVNHKQSFIPVEITTRYRDCTGFTNAQLVDINDLPVVYRANRERTQYKQALLITGGSVVKNK